MIRISKSNTCVRRLMALPDLQLLTPCVLVDISVKCRRISMLHDIGWGGPCRSLPSVPSSDTKRGCLLEGLPGFLCSHAFNPAFGSIIPHFEGSSLDRCLCVKRKVDGIS